MIEKNYKKYIKESIFSSKKNNKKEELEVVERLILNDVINMESTLTDINNLFTRLIGKTISFRKTINNKDTEKEKVTRVEFIQRPGYRYVIRFCVGGYFIAVDVETEIKIWGKRFYSESDPYGEEDWKD